MANAYPGALNNYATGVSSPTLVSAGHAAEHNAIEAKLGIDSSAVTSSIDYLLKNTSSVDPGHKHTLTVSATGTLPVANGGTGQTSLTSLSLTTPKIISSFHDTNGNTLLGITVLPSAVNYVNISNAATSGQVGVGAGGTDSNVSLNVTSQGSGIVKINNVAAVDISTAQTLTNKTLTSPVIRAWDGWEDANEAWTYSSADGQTGVITVPTDATTKYQVGMRIKLTQSATVKYAIITAVAATTLTALFNSDAVLANAAITVPFYSSNKVPLGFSIDPSKYDVITKDTSSRQQLTPTQSTWYNLGSVNIVIPIGLWRVWYNVEATSDEGATSFSFEVALSTANNTNSDSDFHMRYSGSVFANTSTAIVGPISRQKQLSLAAKTTYFLNMLAGNASNAVIRFRGDETPTIIKAEFLLL